MNGGNVENGFHPVSFHFAIFHSCIGKRINFRLCLHGQDPTQHRVLPMTAKTISVSSQEQRWLDNKQEAHNS
jgi:hypothetical protein